MTVLLASALKRAAVFIALTAIFVAPAWRPANADDYPSRVVS